MPTKHTIKVSESVKNQLDKLKQHPRETYNDVLVRLVQKAKSEK